jgi:L-alanine-DL-glutamate epimerase-like enolase superfamily enzyme
MKISKIEPIHISVPYCYGGSLAKADSIPWLNMDTLIVKVTTDEGHVGWGEGFGFSVCAITKVAVERAIAPLAIGRDPTDILALIGDIARKLHNWGRNGPVSFALSALDIALWDIAGQIAGKPLYQLLGRSTTVTRIPAYASLLRYGNAALVAENSAKAVSQGYSRIKLHEITLPEIAAGRAAIPRGMPLMVDTNCPWTAAEAAKMAEAMRDQDIFWLEEPIWPPEDYAALRSLRETSGIPLAAGENAGTRADLHALMSIAKVDYVQPSIIKMGGLTEMLRTRDMAAQFGTKLAPHSPFFGPGLIATTHFNASLPEMPHVERFFCDLEASPMGHLVSPVDGFITVPNQPGLGITMDETVIAKYRVN